MALQASHPARLTQAGASSPHYNLGLLYHQQAFRARRAMDGAEGGAGGAEGAAGGGVGEDERRLLSRAESMYRFALARDPQHVSARSNLGLVLARVGRVVAAKAEFERALLLHPHHPAVLANMRLVASGPAPDS